MAKKSLFIPFYNLDSQKTEDTFYFFLENLLRARIDLHLETGKYDYDEEVNMYVAGLLESLATGRIGFSKKPHISMFDFEIQTYIKNHPGLRDQYIVYKENADFILISHAFFLGFVHDGSYYKRVCKQNDTFFRAQLYYKLAASALGHLKGTNETLVHVLLCLSEQIQDIGVIVKKVASDYFDFVETISEGSFYHLEKEVFSMLQKNNYSAILDDFLARYSDYQKFPTLHRKKEIEHLVHMLKEINPEFRFDTNRL